MEEKPRFWARWAEGIVIGVIVAVVAAYFVGEGRFSPKPPIPKQETHGPQPLPPRTESATLPKQQEIGPSKEASPSVETSAGAARTEVVEERKTKSVSSTAPSESAQEMGIRKSSVVTIPRKDFGNLVVTLSFLRLMSDNLVVVGLSFLNKTERDIVTALDTYELDIRSQRSGIFLTDDSTNRYELKESSGIGEKAMSQFQGGDKSGRWLICPPGVEMTVSLTFAPPRNMEKRGSIFFTSIAIVVGKFYKDNWGDNRFELGNRLNIQFSGVSLK